MAIKSLKYPTAIFVKDEETERFYIRTGPTTNELPASQTQEYIKHREGNWMVCWKI